MMEDTLKALEAEIQAKNDEEWAKVRRFVAGKPIDESAIAKREKELDVRFPPSYRDALKKYGAFTLGDSSPAHDHLVFKIWPLEDHQTALAHYAEELECDPTAEEVAGQIGMDEDVVAALGKVILIGCEGHEDFIGFDLRTQNKSTGECKFRLTLRDDCEIEALSADKSPFKEGRSFDEWLTKHIHRRRSS
jgi:hypothetical protein